MTNKNNVKINKHALKKAKILVYSVIYFTLLRLNTCGAHVVDNIRLHSDIITSRIRAQHLVADIGLQGYFIQTLVEFIRLR